MAKLIGAWALLMVTLLCSLASAQTHWVVGRAGTQTSLTVHPSLDDALADRPLLIATPGALTRAQVAVVPGELLARLSLLSEPVLEHYEEQDPCDLSGMWGFGSANLSSSCGPPPADQPRVSVSVEGVTVEDRFEVSTYEVALLSARDEASLVSWLEGHGHDDAKVSAASAWPWLKSGGRLLVARRQPRHVGRGGDDTLRGEALQVRWAAPALEVPMGAGLLMAREGELVRLSALSSEGRLAVAEQESVSLPTDVQISPAAAKRSEAYMAAIWARVTRAYPGRWITAYASGVNGSDEALSSASLGELVAGAAADAPGESWRLTMLQARLSEVMLRRSSLRLMPSAPLSGGYGRPEGLRGRVAVDGAAGFRVRLIVLRPWRAALTCEDPQRWGWALTRREQVALSGASPVDARTLDAQTYASLKPRVTLAP